ncbi:hypothetical protein [Variovorax terrae]|uniref:Uncharacterized protein n=1 Tax=Variovorax terrae TaxID=2923278 RepID=A0A9X2AS05_9BURK|nr:hypothetical protein [Variovorax terrae]MCJ0766072.1 hypothetical protein [Variovorax terrae]
MVDVALAGLAYAGSGDEQVLDKRFPESRRYEKALQDAGTPIQSQLLRTLAATPPSHLRIVSQIDELKGRTQALAVALVIGSETVSVDQFGPLHKLMVLIRGQTMFFDFKSMTVVRAYPISFAYVDSLDHYPGPDEIQERVRLVFEGANDKPGLLARFVNNVARAEIPAQVPRYLQVTSVQIQPEALEALPAHIKSEPGAAETWAADLVSEAISTRAGVPIVPYAKGYAIGNVMSMRISDGTVWELKLPKPDYEISTELSGFKKIKFSEVPGGATSFVYGAYAQLRIEEPLSRKAYLNTALKNGETRVIPASQGGVNDFEHFYDAVNRLFVKLAQVIGGTGDEKWLKSAAAAKDIEQQISQTKELMKLCK